MAIRTHSNQQERHPWAGISEDTEGRRILRWFERTIWHDNQVCTHCFHRLRSTAEIEKDDWGNVVETVEYQSAAEKGYDLEEPPESVASVIPLARERTTCAECGSVGGLAQPDPLSKDNAVDRVPQLVARLREHGHALDVDVVYDTVRKLKSDEDRASDDKRVFAAAAGLGVKHG